MSSSISVRSRSDMCTIRFARLRYPQDETKCGETFRALDCRLAVEADDVARSWAKLPPARASRV